MAQVWDQVKVIGGEYDGQAGTVVGTDPVKKHSIVKLDGNPVEIGFEDAELQFLGR